MINHCFTHTRSDCCWKKEIIDVPHEAAKHGAAGAPETSIEHLCESDQGTQHVKLAVLLCRMKFSCNLTHPLSNNDHTGGQACVSNSRVEFDKNGQPRHIAERNHPRVVQEPVGALHWGANGNVQPFLTNCMTSSIAACVLRCWRV